ncbi:CoA transferase subunit A [Cupriavidus pinatubonensis]|uniref:3-oxoadipate CoA-transferase subunit A n=1 Tax=Cupriavidus pinatubonensis TaxID=248026 RepID=A0ABM8WTJ5_9BURK|nr:CoA-transferase [Cupriavidus pinatubonensis]CAG9170794.1 3-oxoadipate CoA-transferase subunit A [Cupriavidus pinatubonensis]
MTQQASKLGTLAQAADLIPNGTRLALGGFAIYQHPMALVRELIRQRKRDLTVVGTVSGIEIDMLAGAGCLKAVETSYVGLEKYGLAPNFRRAVEQGALEMVDYPEVLSFDRFRATQEAMTFWPCDYLGGTDVLKNNPAIKSFTCPITERTLFAVPPADPDVVVIHAIAADEQGNVLFPRRHLLPQGLDVTMALGCKTVIVTVESIVSKNYIKRHAELNLLPSYKTTLVVEVPFGAHPCPVLGRYGVDDRHFTQYAEAAKSPETFGNYLEKYVSSPANHEAYLDLVGAHHLASLLETDSV